MRVLVVGAAGKYAGLVIPELLKRGVTIRALLRKEAKAAGVREQGVAEIAIGDLEDAESLPASLKEVDGVFHINPAFAPKEAELGVAMVKAAQAAGVRKFVFSGAIHPTISSMANHAGKQAVEEAIYESGMDFTVLQPTMFMQTLGNGWPAVVSQNRFVLPYSTQAKACYVDYRDVAETAALALTGNTLAYGTFELCAPGMVNRIELAAIMSEALGKKVEASELPFDEWAQVVHMPDSPVREGMRRMFANYNMYGFPGGNALILRAILGREPRTLAQYFQELARS